MVATDDRADRRASAGTPLLELRNVTKVFQSGIRKTATSQTVALRDASLVVPSEFPTATAVAGESGSGKTTMARLLLGFIKPTSGQILYKGVDITKMDKAQARAVPARGPADLPGPVRGLQPVLQGRPRADHAAAATSASPRMRRKAAERIEEALEMVGLRPRETLGRYPHELSGGQRQRIMVARALLLRPKIIMADEPVSMVDASLRATILDELRKLNTEFGISLLYITHDLTTAYQVCDNIVVLYQGSVAEAGSVERVIRDPQASLHAAAGLLDPADRTARSAGVRTRSPPRRRSRAASPTAAGSRRAAPSVMERVLDARSRRCSRSTRTAPHRATCTRQAPVLPSEGIGEVFHRPRETTHTGRLTAERGSAHDARHPDHRRLGRRRHRQPALSRGCRHRRRPHRGRGSAPGRHGGRA